MKFIGAIALLAAIATTTVAHAGSAVSPRIESHIPRAQIFNNHMDNPERLPGVGFVWGTCQGAVE